MAFCRWRILKITDEHGLSLFKLFQAFSLGMNDWWLNSGIVKVEETPESYVVYGVSGSEYEVAKTDEGDSPALEGFLVEAQRGFVQTGMDGAMIEISNIAEYRESKKHETYSSRRHPRPSQ